MKCSTTSRSEEHTSELQSRLHLVCRLLLDPAPTELYTLSLHDALPIYRQHLRDRLVRLEREQAGDVAALGVALCLGQVVGLGAVDAPGGGEEQQPVVVGGRDEVLDHVEIGRAHV